MDKSNFDWDIHEIVVFLQALYHKSQLSRIALEHLALLHSMQ